MTSERPAGRVSHLRITPVKGLALVDREWVDVGPYGVAEDRRFYLVGPDGRHRSGLAHGPLVRIVPSYDAVSERLELRFPSGALVEGSAVSVGDPFEVPWSDRRTLLARHVPGFDEALSDHVGMPLRLVRAEPGHRPSSAHVTIISTASIEAIESAADLPEPLDDRRFRMLVTIDGVPAHEEERWVGGQVAIGTAVVRVDVPTARCATTTRDPRTGLRDIDVLRLLAEVRGVSERKTVDLGVYTDVLRPGRIAVGDEVRPIKVDESAA